MKIDNLMLPALCGVALLASSSSAVSDTLDYIGTGLTWPTNEQWVKIDGANDPDDGVNVELDFVGDTTDPMAYTYRNEDFVYFRMRLDTTTGADGTFKDAHLVLIDVVGQQWDASGQEPDGTAGGLIAGDDGGPDYGFAWDSANQAQVEEHGLEMQVRGTVASTWGNTTMNDIDGNGSDKGLNDINGDLTNRGQEGYVRATWNTTETLGTTNFGDTTFLDFAVSWDYLTAYTDLNQEQTWRVAFGSISVQNDHAKIGADVGGGANPDTTTLTTGWAEITPTDVPVPPSIALVTLGIGLLSGRNLLRRRGFPHAA